MSDPRPRALFLDLDGTLADSLPAMRAVYDAFLAEHARRGSTEEFDRLNGPALPEIVRTLRAAHALADSVETLEACYRALIAERYPIEARLAPGARVLLQCAARLELPIAIVTSAEASIAERFLVTHGLEHHVTMVVTAEGLTHGKPAPDIYLSALAAMKVSAGEVWAVEDSPNGLRAATSAGLRVYAVGLAASSMPPGVHAHLSSLAELVASLECDLEVLPGDVEIVASATLSRYEDSIERQVDDLWADELRACPDRHDGSLLAYVDRAGASLRARFVHYRHYLAQRSDSALAEKLAIVPLSVSGLLRCGDAIAFARRGAGTTQYPGWLELVPSGGIDADRLRPDGTVDHTAQLVSELAEEAGIDKAHILRLVPLALVRDRVDVVVDLASLIEVGPEARAIAERSIAAGSVEYEGLRWIELAALRAFLDEEPLLVPVSRALCELLLRDPVR